MATATRTLTNKTPNGTIEIRIERTIEVQSKVNYSDGWNVDLGEEAVDSICIEVFVNGRRYAEAYGSPYVLSAESRRRRKAPAAAYAVIGMHTYISRERYDEIMTLIAEMEAELTTAPEAQRVEEIKARDAYRAQKAEAEQEIIAAEIAQRNAHPGWCNKCQSYCYGDCEANS